MTIKKLHLDISYNYAILNSKILLSNYSFSISLEGRALDSIGGGNILRGAHAGAAPRGSLDSIGGGNILRG